MHRRILAAVIISWFLAVCPAKASMPGPEPIFDNPVEEVRGAKQLTPLLDLIGKELEKAGIRLFDNAVYSMERLWHDTVNWNLTKKTKI